MFKATIIFSRLFIDKFLFPCSTPAMYVRSNSARKANFSWLSPCSLRNSRILFPTTSVIIPLPPKIRIIPFETYKSTDYESHLFTKQKSLYCIFLLCNISLPFHLILKMLFAEKNLHSLQTALQSFYFQLLPSWRIRIIPMRITCSDFSIYTMDK